MKIKTIKIKKRRKTKWDRVVSERRLGYFWVRFGSAEAWPAGIRKIFNKMIIIYARQHWVAPKSLYCAYCAEFNPVPPGAITPFYTVTYDTKTRKLSAEIDSDQPEIIGM